MFNIVFYTNCQWRGIKPYLEQIYINSNFYIIENYELINETRKIDYLILKNADLFIYQHIGKHHGIYTTSLDISNNILSFLSINCIKISIPYIYNNSFWILIPPSHGDGFIGEYSDMNKYINKEPIIKLKQQGYSLDKVLEMYHNGNIDFDFENRFNNSINILKEKEKYCDITVSDFIQLNYKTHKLFFTQNHPTTCVFVHIVNKMMKLLNINKQFEEFPENINICNLNIYWYHTMYDSTYFNFSYDNPDTLYNPNWYIYHIKNIYLSY